MHPLRALFVSALSLVVVGPAMATTDDFIETCMAHAGDLTALPQVLEARGLEEVDATTGPQFMPLPDNARRRLWQRPVSGDEKSALYVGLIHVPGAVPVTLCAVTGFPGDTASVALQKLQARYLPFPDSIARGPDIFYGGREGWIASVDGANYELSVSWAFGGTPDVGPSTQMLLAP